MSKRQILEDCYSPFQRKMRIRQKEVDKGVASDRNMAKVYEHTLSLLFSGAKISAAGPIVQDPDVPPLKTSENCVSKTLDSWVNVQSPNKNATLSSCVSDSCMDSQPGPSGVRNSISQQKSLTSFFNVQNRQKPSDRFQNDPLPQSSRKGLFNGDSDQGSQVFSLFRSPVAGPSRNQGTSSSMAGGSSSAGSSKPQSKMIGFLKNKPISNVVVDDVPMKECAPQSKMQCSVCRRELCLSGTPCDYCSFGACQSCLVHCSSCQGSFCSKCALPDYEGNGDVMKCLSCFN